MERQQNSETKIFTVVIVSLSLTEMVLLHVKDRTSNSNDIAVSSVYTTGWTWPLRHTVSKIFGGNSQEENESFILLNK